MDPLDSTFLTPTFPKTNKLGGVIKAKSNPLITFAQTLFNTLQCKKRCIDDSSALPHKMAQKVRTSEVNNFAQLDFFSQGFYLKKVFKKKQPLSMELCFSKYLRKPYSFSPFPNFSHTNNLSNFLQQDFTEKNTPSSAFQNHLS